MNLRSIRGLAAVTLLAMGCSGGATTSVAPSTPSPDSPASPPAPQAVEQPALVQPVAALPADPHRHALLVGCSHYPNLDKKLQLAGPANDVVLARKLLQERFQFAPENIVELSEAAGPDSLPTRANIDRQWKRLAELAKPGEVVVVLMTGHGTQAPSRADDPNDPEPDGLDEVFLPRDIGKWSNETGAVENSILDDDLKAWTAAIHDRGAALWVVIDSCHSGTMTRSAGGDVRREVRPQDVGVPEAALQQAHQRAVEGDQRDEPQLFASKQHSTGTARGVPDKAEVRPPLVALFASQSVEPAIEQPLPRRGTDQKYHGLLTYTLCDVLSQAQTPMTYRQLVQRIHQQYLSCGRLSPTPLLEGPDLDQLVLGLEKLPGPAQFLISGNSLAGWSINAGALAGLTEGSILAVYPPAGEAQAGVPLGHVRIQREGLGAVSTQVEPCAHEKLPAPKKLAAGMRCVPVFINLGDHRLRVVIDSATDKGEEVPAGLRELPQSDLKASLAECSHLATAVEDPAQADWLLRYDTLASKKQYLVPVSGWQGHTVDNLPPLFGPVPEGNAGREWIVDSLTRIARVQTLLQLAGTLGRPFDGTGLSVTLRLHKDEADKQGQVLDFGTGGIKLYDGERISVRAEYATAKETPPDGEQRESYDVTVLLIDSGYGIEPCLPSESQPDNRLFRGTALAEEYTVVGEGTTTTGLEHAVAIAVKSTGQSERMDFSFLAQSTIAKARAVDEPATLRSPLGELMQAALYGAGTARGLSSQSRRECQIYVLSWTTLPGKRP